MGKRGPKKTPTKILKLRGSSRANGREGEVYADGRPKCPDWLNDKAKTVWRWLTSQLDAMGLLAKADRDTIARYCVVLVQWRQAIEALDKGGPNLPIRNAEGEVVDYKERPEVARSMKLSDQLNRLNRAFGLSPADRAGLTAVQSLSKQNMPDKSRFFVKAN